MAGCTVKIADLGATTTCAPHTPCPKCGHRWFYGIGVCSNLSCALGGGSAIDLAAGPSQDGFSDDLDEVLDGLRSTLLQKNAAYGDSALSPLRVFSHADPEEQIRTRLDDKLSRIARGDGSGNEDAEADALGYLVLLRIAKLRRERAIQKPTPDERK